MAASDYVSMRHALSEHLRNRGISDERVLTALGEVPRDEFIPDHLKPRSYEDVALPIGLGQTISQPFTVAYMCAALQLRGEEIVLEIGTGSGYGACVLSRLARWVYTIERLPELAQETRQRIERLGYRNIEIRIGDGSLGLPDAAPFDGIIVTAGAEHLPSAYGEQLAEGGRIVIPVGPSPRRQSLMRYTRHGDELRVENLGEFAFVPLIGADAWDAPDEAGL